MRVAISSNGQDLQSQLDPRFGRCNYFLIINLDDMSFEAVNNSGKALSGGAGIQSAQLVADKGVNTIITGNCGPNATQALTAAGIELILGQMGTVKDVIERYKKGELKPITDESSGNNYGRGMGGGRGRGLGGGRGRRR
ncbi:MAG: NifB/NifX family molybdenum-iron cluster-binding protein [Deltaproteobacteria bacterium]|nr:NifB/NifX family molybdenum-iron cluster-binding protein [Deltaproteobacteria bacterium]